MTTDTLTFTYEEINMRYNNFVNGFLYGEQGVTKTEVLPRYWFIEVPSKDFSVNMKLECTGQWHDVDQWCAIVMEKDGSQSSFLLFEDEIEAWAEDQRRKRGIE